MKKILSLALGLGLALSANATTWVCTGEFNGWDLGSGVKFTATADDANVFTCVVPKLKSGFKIVDRDSNWEIQYGSNRNETPEPTIEIETPYNLSSWGASEKGGNIEFADKDMYIQNAALTFDLNDLTLTITSGTFAEVEYESGYAVVGSYTTPDWNFEASVTLTGKGPEVTCTIPKLTSDFKIVYIADDNWDIQYGTATPIEVGETYVLDGKVGSTDPANIKFAGMIQEVLNAHVTFNITTHELTITAEDDDVISGYPTLYFTGSYYNGEDWPAPGTAGTYLCDFDEATTTYTVKVNLGYSSPVEFKLAGSGWSNQIGGGVVVGTSPVKVEASEVNLTTTLTGEQTLVFNYETMMMNFVDVAGVENISVDNNISVEYFNLKGVKVENPQNGVFIRIQGSETNKVIL